MRQIKECNILLAGFKLFVGKEVVTFKNYEEALREGLEAFVQTIEEANTLYC